MHHKRIYATVMRHDLARLDREATRTGMPRARVVEQIVTGWAASNRAARTLAKPQRKPAKVANLKR